MLQALDRDPPSGKNEWKVRVQVRDGQAPWDRLEQGQPSRLFTRYPRSAVGGVTKGPQHTHTNTQPLSQDTNESRRRQKGTRTEDGVDNYSKRNQTPEGADYTDEVKVSLSYPQESIITLVKRNNVRKNDDDPLRTKLIDTMVSPVCPGSHVSNRTIHNDHKNWRPPMKQLPGNEYSRVSSVPTRPNDGDSHSLRQIKHGFLPSRSYRPWLRGVIGRAQHSPRGPQVKSKDFRIKGGYPTGEFSVFRDKYHIHPNVYFKSRLAGRSFDTIKRKTRRVQHPHFLPRSIRRLRDALRSEDSITVLPADSELDEEEILDYGKEYIPDFRSRLLRYLDGLEMVSDGRLIRAGKKLKRTQSNSPGKQEETPISVVERSPNFVSLPVKPRQPKLSNSSSKKKTMTRNKKYQAYTTNPLEHAVLDLQNISEAPSSSETATRPASKGRRFSSRPQLTRVERSMDISGPRRTSSPHWPTNSNLNMATDSHLSRDSSITQRNKTSSMNTTNRRKRRADSLLYDSDEFGRLLTAEEENEEGCKDFFVNSRRPEVYNGTSAGYLEGKWRGGRVHVMETVVTVVVKDINDNAPKFPNATMFGEVQENGPIGEY